MTWHLIPTPGRAPGQSPAIGVTPACDRCRHAWWVALGEPAPVYANCTDGARWLAEIYGWYTGPARLLCPPCAAAWCAAIGHPWKRCPPMHLGGQLIDPAVRICVRCGDWQYLTEPQSDGAHLTAAERDVLAALEQQFGDRGDA